MKSLTAVLWSILALALCGSAGLAVDLDHGEQLARRWCVACHIIAVDQTGPATEAPSFPSIARRQGFDQNGLAYFLLDPHPKMPNMSLTRTEATDLAAYIATLGK